MSLIEDELARLEVLHKTGVHAPWWWTEAPDASSYLAVTTERGPSLVVDAQPHLCSETKDLIAAARNALPALIAEVRLLREAIEKEVRCAYCGGKDTRCAPRPLPVLRPGRKLGEP